MKLGSLAHQRKMYTLVAITDSWLGFLRIGRTFQLQRYTLITSAHRIMHKFVRPVGETTIAGSLNHRITGGVLRQLQLADVG